MRGHGGAICVGGADSRGGGAAGADYMMLRSQRTGFGDRCEVWTCADESVTRLDPRRVVCDDPDA
ncbi:hypothetical protein GCM10010182_00330 [Actinomadura cremea]|nr:hypothetical protein GCM10010182_00330 [Actinomadura cremea]